MELSSNGTARALAAPISVQEFTLRVPAAEYSLKAEAMDEFVEIACTLCYWRGRRSQSVLDRDRLVSCPRCYALISARAAKMAGRSEVTVQQAKESIGAGAAYARFRGGT
jgi:hypothetical protein